MSNLAIFLKYGWQPWSVRAQVYAGPQFQHVNTRPRTHIHTLQKTARAIYRNAAAAEHSVPAIPIGHRALRVCAFVYECDAVA